MKKIFFLVLFSGFNFCLFSQITDSLKKKSPKTFVSIFSELQVYTPMKSNTFEMTTKLSSGGVINIPIGKNFGVMFGGRMWVNTVNGYTFKSRYWSQFGTHGAIGFVYSKHKKNHQISVGPVIAKVSYIVSGVPYSLENKKYQDFTKAVESSSAGIRGNYYTSPYLFFSFKRKVQKSFLELELNALVPGKWPQIISSWQPKALVHVIRNKIIYEKNNFGIKIDIQVPALMESRLGGYKSLFFKELTGKAELHYSFKMTGGKICPILGYERDWHALNYPHLLKGQSGTWGSIYLGFRFQSFIF